MGLTARWTVAAKIHSPVGITKPQACKSIHDETPPIHTGNFIVPAIWEIAIHMLQEFTTFGTAKNCFNFAR